MAAVRVKICGITRPEDAVAAEAAGADAIGLVFAPGSPRLVSPETAREIRAAVGPLMTVVGVFRDADFDEVDGLAEGLRLGAVQLHGTEPPEYAARLRRRVSVIKAFLFEPGMPRRDIAQFPSDGVLLDGLRPGSGRAFDWEAAAPLAGMPRLVLAGGLRPDNVAAGVRALRPYAVDVSSGVEVRPGVKDVRLMEEFVKAAQAAARETPV